MPISLKIDKESYLVPIGDLVDEDKQEPYVASERDTALI